MPQLVESRPFRLLSRLTGAPWASRYACFKPVPYLSQAFCIRLDGLPVDAAGRQSVDAT